MCCAATQTKRIVCSSGGDARPIFKLWEETFFILFVCLRRRDKRAVVNHVIGKIFLNFYSSPHPICDPLKKIKISIIIQSIKNPDFFVDLQSDGRIFSFASHINYTLAFSSWLTVTSLFHTCSQVSQRFVHRKLLEVKISDMVFSTLVSHFSILENSIK